VKIFRCIRKRYKCCPWQENKELHVAMLTVKV